MVPCTALCFHGAGHDFEDVQEVSPGMRPVEVGNASIRAMGKSHGESCGYSMTSMNFLNAFIGNSMRESMTL